MSQNALGERSESTSVICHMAPAVVTNFIQPRITHTQLQANLHLKFGMFSRSFVQL